MVRKEIFIKAQTAFPVPNRILKNNIGDAHTPYPGEIVFDTRSYRSSETIQKSGYFPSSVSYIKVQKCLSREITSTEKEDVSKDKVLKQVNSSAKWQH